MLWVANSSLISTFDIVDTNVTLYLFIVHLAKTTVSFVINVFTKSNLEAYVLSVNQPSNLYPSCDTFGSDAVDLYATVWVAIATIISGLVTSVTNDTL